ncbi:ScbA/BarX family gamma-butyrolactone biosynthesis protein [Streptomyces shenzhenensis]|uniref:ScbA/BarX family gamma-butyrolactone biosynthesis protein n=1 Tax=Streptomyces shenzhenensis TaxID=943815 RepID=UPI003D8EBEFD
MSASTYRATHSIRSAPLARSETAAPMGNGCSGHPSLTTTVPKEYVHRASIAEVMLTDWKRDADGHFTVAAQWPRGHSFFTAVQGCHDPLIAAETIRQAGILLCHTEFGVPLDHHFLLSKLRVSVLPARLLIGSAPAGIDLHMVFSDTRQHRGRLTSGRLETILRRDGRAVATGSAAFTCASPAVYQRLRGRRRDLDCRPLPLTTPLPPQLVGRLLPMDVVLSPTDEAHRFQLRLDIRHPVLFDHPVDHAPGMALIEAARQATTATLGRVSLPLSIETDFLRYVELDAPCFLVAQRVPGGESDGHESIRVTGYQGQETVYGSTVTVPTPTGRPS